MSSSPPAGVGLANAALIWARVLGLAFLGWGAWLSFPGRASNQESRPGLTAVVVDSSASLTRRRTGWEARALRDVLKLALQAEERGDDLLLVAYAADVRRVFGPSPASEAVRALRGGEGLRFGLPPERSLESRLAQALAVVEAPLLEPDRGPCRLFLRTDDSFTGAGPSGVLARLAALGVAIESVAVATPDQADVALTRFEVPRWLELGATAMARFEVDSHGIDPSVHGAKLELELEFLGDTERRTLQLPALQRGAATATHLVELGAVRAGTLRVRARVVLTNLAGGYEGDRIPENDRAQAEIQSREALTCVVVTEDVEPVRDWIGILPDGIEVRFTEPAALGIELERADVCLAVDVSLAELDGVLLGAFVRRGGGLLVAGGWPLLRDWETESAQRMSALLPLTPAEDDRPPRDVQFVVDGSGSMNGEPFRAVRAALLGLVPSTPLADRVSLRFFTGALQRRTILTAGEPGDGRSRTERARELLAETVPGGQTLLVDSLEQLANERQGTAEEALVLVLSDGHESNGFNAHERAAALALRFAATRTTLRMIAVGADPDLDLLRAFLPPGTEPTRVLDFAGLDEVFQRTVNHERVEEGPLALVVPEFASEELGSGLARSLQSGRLPRLARALLTREREGASVLLRSASGNSVLGLQRVGLGLTAFLATGPGADWSGELRLAEDLGGLLRRLGREAQPERTPRFRAGDSLVLENAPIEWPAFLCARFAVAHAGIQTPLGECRLGLSSPKGARDPRASRSVAWPGFLDSVPRGSSVSVDLLDANGERLSRLSLLAPGPPEFLRAKPLRLPQEFAPIRPQASGRSGGRHPFAPLALILGLGLSMLAALGHSRAVRSALGT